MNPRLTHKHTPEEQQATDQLSAHFSAPTATTRQDIFAAPSTTQKSHHKRVQKKEQLVKIPLKHLSHKQKKKNSYAKVMSHV